MLVLLQRRIDQAISVNDFRIQPCNFPCEHCYKCIFSCYEKCLVRRGKEELKAEWRMVVRDAGCEPEHSSIISVISYVFTFSQLIKTLLLD